MACKGKIRQGTNIDYPHKDKSTSKDRVRGPDVSILKSKPGRGLTQEFCLKYLGIDHR